MIIYKVTNKINEKIYIGQTVQKLNERINAHKSSAKNDCQYSFHKAIRKYGFNNFEWEILEKYITDKNHLDKLELYYIKRYNSLTPNGYNMTLNTCGNLGHDFSGKNNPRYDDHRSYEELHGKEKADKLKKEMSNITKNASNNIWNWKKNNLSYNPMNDPKSREKLSKTRMGGNNPAAIYSWKFILPNGIVYETDCLRQFCKETKFKRHTIMRITKDEKYKPRDKFYQDWLVEKKIKHEGRFDDKKKKAE